MPSSGDDVTESTTVEVDATPASIEAAVRRLDLAAPVTRALTALNVAGRFALVPTLLRRPGSGGLLFGTIWHMAAGSAADRVPPERFESFDSPGYVKASWAVDVVAFGDRALLSIDSRFAATDDRSAARLLDAWSLIGPLSHALRSRAAHAVRDFAEELAE
jgi:hypothetical protein